MNPEALRAVRKAVPHTGSLAAQRKGRLFAELIKLAKGA